MTKKKQIDARSLTPYTSLANWLAEMLVDAAMTGQALCGRGLLCVRSTQGNMTWTYKAVADCAEELYEWPELQGLMPIYDPATEVLIALMDEGDFLRLPVNASGGDQDPS